MRRLTDFHDGDGGEHRFASPPSSPSSPSEKTRLLWADQVRILAALAVVSVHVTIPIMEQTSLGDPILRAAAKAGWVLSIWAAPLFFILSGYLLSEKARTQSVWTFWKKRLGRIGLPLLFWSSFYIGWRNLGFRPALSPVERPPTWIEALWSGEPHYHMWFLYTLLIFYLLLPLLAKRPRCAWMALFFLLIAGSFILEVLVGIINSEHHYIIPFPLTAMCYLIYFLSGGLWKWKSRLPFSKPLLIAGLCFGVLIGTSSFGITGFLFIYSSPIVLVLSIAMFQLFGQLPAPRSEKTIKRLRILSGCTLGIYLIHPVWLDLLKTGGWDPSSLPPIIAWTFIPLTIAAVFCLSALTTAALKTVPYLKRTV